MRLDVRVLGSEEPLDAVNGQLLCLVDVLAPAVVPFAGIPFGILVGEEGACRLQDGGAAVVL
jgi:hypothetical protein